jgi:N-carbamoyl-L-amino-acid hydrolase
VDGTRLGEELVRIGYAGTAPIGAIRPHAFIELHIEQGPVLEAMKKPVGVVLGTMGVERYNLRFQGQAAHSGAAPIHLRKDAFLAAAEFALACRDISIKYSGKAPRDRVVATCGVVKVEPNFVTAVPGSTEISIDLRALDAGTLKKMLADARKAADRAAKTHHVEVKWSSLLQITPRLFDDKLLDIVRAATKEVTGSAPELPSGPLHDAAEMQAVVPTAMVFAQSSPGISHTRFEDTPPKALDQSIRTFLIAVERTLALLGTSARTQASAGAKRRTARPSAKQARAST